MKFTDEDLENNTIIKGSKEQPCMNCRDLTLYIDYLFEGHICSKKCSDLLWNEYGQHLESVLMYDKLDDKENLQ